jgi:hypothetical protein
MRNYRLWAGAMLGLAGCGGATLSGGLDGEWTGNAVAAFGAGGSYTYPAALLVGVSGNTATLRNFCSDGTGSVSATGSDDSASYSGNFTCASIPIADCAAVVFIYTKLSVTLTGTDSLAFAGTGSAGGCGENTSLVTTLVGSNMATAVRVAPIASGGFGAGSWAVLKN